MEKLQLDEMICFSPQRSAEVIALDDALTALAQFDARKARVIELRFFAGLTLDQAAGCLDLSPSTADRAWRYARAWLAAAMAGDNSEEK